LPRGGGAASIPHGAEHAEEKLAEREREQESARREAESARREAESARREAESARREAVYRLTLPAYTPNPHTV
jgi:sRNA-binding protein